MRFYVACQGELVKLVDAGVKGFKCFMIDSGVEVDLSGWSLAGACFVLNGQPCRNSHAFLKVTCDLPWTRLRYEDVCTLLKCFGRQDTGYRVCSLVPC